MAEKLNIQKAIFTEKSTWVDFPSLTNLTDYNETHLVLKKYFLLREVLNPKVPDLLWLQR
jgi:hypothetical protein